MLVLTIIAIHAFHVTRGKWIGRSHKVLLGSVFVITGVTIATGSYWLFVVSAFLGLFSMGMPIKGMKRLAVRDSLTGVPNRHYFFDGKFLEVSKKVNNNQPITVVMLDIDGFKRFNDTYGHLEGDKRLREVAEILKSSVRKNDVVVRYGGDEFLLVLHADENDAKRVMKRIEEELQKYLLRIQKMVPSRSCG
ncbi:MULTISPECIES: GGDEF domain-containing protein [unclassified Thermotoga]|uniref:GGDEF domain-containing protein n=1 Tax=Thermotoga sp. 2812B TaxID=1157948 RepID=UPI000280E88E|nr:MULTISPECIES: GGDEF domain-containing protein [unclassified Thermotoga]AIY85729.1 diguanylate cyclase [Thermotoga sp. 2812B]EJX26983.1 diguanylate cyclase [Thermotoga sp. EMP]